MGRLLLAWLASSLAAVGGSGCSCNGDKPPDPCPASFTIGELCPTEGLACTWPASKCGTTVCTCQNQVGGFYWTCKTSWCACTCPCGFTARVGCDSLACDAKPEDSCPPEVAGACDLVCGMLDGGPSDGRVDGPPPDRPVPPDRTQESRPDSALDKALDRAADRAAHDRPADATGGELGAQ